MNRSSARGALAILVPLLALAPAARAQIENKDVYVLANQLADEVELIREVMGRPYDDSPRLPVSQASEFEVLFQAQTLYRKANQLAYEIAGTPRRAPPPAPYREVTPADVHALVASALEQIRLVKNEIGIEEEVLLQERDAGISPTGNFLIIIDINRQLNLLISTTIRAADVFEEVSFAVVYTAGILQRVTGRSLLPEPVFEGYKRPSDNYRRLLECIEIVNRIAPKAGVSVLGISSRRNLPDDVEPGHVYDIANILVADLAMLAKAFDAAEVRPSLPPTPKHIFPSHVYQRTGVLLEQLMALEAAL
jgi:hypothetical protein